jgi:hypothetical protein
MIGLLINLIIAGIIIGVILYLVKIAPFIPGEIKDFITVLVWAIFCIWALLQVGGLLTSGGPYFPIYPYGGRR